MNLERLRSLLEHDPETGLFLWKLDHSPRAQKGSIAGYTDPITGYRLIGIDGSLYLQHRLAWLYETGKWPANQIDHRNLVRCDNKFSNLREATNAQNHQNVRKNANNTSGFVGVSYHKRIGKWMAHIGLNNRKIFLGYFGTPEDANEVRLEAKMNLHKFNPMEVSK